MRFVFQIVVSVVLFCHVQATEYYVDPVAGGDTFPWKTISHAFSVIQPGDILNLYAGTYQPISTVPGGSPGMPVTIMSVAGQRALITDPYINNGILIKILFNIAGLLLREILQEIVQKLFGRLLPLQEIII